PEVFVRLCKRYDALAATVRLDEVAVRAMLERAGKDKVKELFIDLVLVADLDVVEIDMLLRLAAKKAEIGLRPLAKLLKQRQAEQAARRAAAERVKWLAERAKRRAERTDPRPPKEVPAPDAPWLPQMDVVNSVLGVLQTAEPPSRDIDTGITRAR